MQDPDLTDRIFHQLLYLELHLHKRLNGDRILSLLKHSPNLQTLKLNEVNQNVAVFYISLNSSLLYVLYLTQMPYVSRETFTFYQGSTEYICS